MKATSLYVSESLCSKEQKVDYQMAWRKMTYPLNEAKMYVTYLLAISIYSALVNGAEHASPGLFATQKIQFLEHPTTGGNPVSDSSCTVF